MGNLHPCMPLHATMTSVMTHSTARCICMSNFFCVLFYICTAPVLRTVTWGHDINIGNILLIKLILSQMSLDCQIKQFRCACSYGRLINNIRYTDVFVAWWSGCRVYQAHRLQAGVLLRQIVSFGAPSRPGGTFALPTVRGVCAAVNGIIWCTKL